MFKNVSESKDGLKSSVISTDSCSFDTKQKIRPFFKSRSTMSQKVNIDLKVT